MSLSDPNRAQLVRVAQALGDLRNEMVFVGGATVGLLITDPAAPRVRPTDDVRLATACLRSASRRKIRTVDRELLQDAIDADVTLD